MCSISDDDRYQPSLRRPGLRFAAHSPTVATRRPAPAPSQGYTAPPMPNLDRLPAPLVLELEVLYPEQILESANGQGYMFRVDIGASSSEADLKSDAFSKEPNTDMVLSSQSTRLLSLQVPHTSE